MDPIYIPVLSFWLIGSESVSSVSAHRLDERTAPSIVVCTTCFDKYLPSRLICFIVPVPLLEIRRQRHGFTLFQSDNGLHEKDSSCIGSRSFTQEHTDFRDLTYLKYLTYSWVSLSSATCPMLISPFKSPEWVYLDSVNRICLSISCRYFSDTLPS
ncbi:hypothetical protein VTK73DRAFT_6565 [Phialemonium thermophilum]|uniref:Uncharacterized protein n=1 Tax=Phialemonium thermophilum TaxID=223376 RepID=A0ABR3WJ03_9PEZI